MLTKLTKKDVEKFVSDSRYSANFVELVHNGKTLVSKRVGVPRFELAYKGVSVCVSSKASSTKLVEVLCNLLEVYNWE